MRMLTTCLLLSLATSVSAQSPTSQGEFGDWTVYTRDAGGDRICYALSQPTAKIPDSVDHGEVWFMVASWRSGAATEQPSLLTGYNLKVTSPPRAQIGALKVPMYAAQSEAFVEDDADERKLVRNMRAGAQMRINATSERGTATAYDVSLKGITAALRKVKAACG